MTVRVSEVRRETSFSSEGNGENLTHSFPHGKFPTQPWRGLSIPVDFVPHLRAQPEMD